MYNVLEETHTLHFIVTFMAVFAVTFFFLSITMRALLGKDKEKLARKYAGLVSFVFAFFILYHLRSPESFNVVMSFLNVFGLSFYILLAMFFSFLVISSIVRKEEIKMPAFIGIISFIILIYIAWINFPTMQKGPTEFKIDENILAFLAVILPIGIMVGLLYLATRPVPDTSQQQQQQPDIKKKMFDVLKKLLEIEEK